MRDLIIQIFGSYRPIVGPAISPSGELVEIALSGLAGVDWPYVLGVGLFALVLYCFFKLLGGVLK